MVLVIVKEGLLGSEGLVTRVDHITCLEQSHSVTRIHQYLEPNLLDKSNYISHYSIFDHFNHLVVLRFGVAFVSFSSPQASASTEFLPTTS